MGYVICDRTTLIPRSWEAIEQLQPFNNDTEVVIQWPTPPNIRTQRWDGGTGLRAATAQEVVGFDTTKVDDEVQSLVDNKLIRAVLVYLVQRLNELRAQPTQAFPALTAADVRQGIIAAYKLLL